MGKKRKKTEFSKIIFFGISVSVLLVVAFTCYMIYITQDLSPLMYLIPCMFTEMAAATGFYFNKAKMENELKIKKSFGIPVIPTVEEPTDEHF